jgi:hypothetical protein
MSNVKNPKTNKTTCGESCSCGCPQNACQCTETNCQCGCQKLAPVR